MLKLPTVDPSTPVVNTVLGPYFTQVKTQLLRCPEDTRLALLDQYKSYIEHSAQKASSKAVRIQLRINLAELIRQVTCEPDVHEPNVLGKSSRERLFDGTSFRGPSADEQDLLFEV